MGIHHDHHGACGHGEHGQPQGGGRLGIALVVIAAFAVVEVVGGVLSGSLALLADAGHMVTDAAALALALSAQWLAKRPASERFPFGMKRAQVLAAFINGLALLLIVGFLLIEALGRLGNPQGINAQLMMTVAIVGLAANIVAFFILHPSAKDDVNVKGAMLHVAADIFGSVAAIISALVIMATGFLAIDAILTLAVCALILHSAVPLVRETGSILMQSAPSDLRSDEVAQTLCQLPDVLEVHGVRAWQLTPGETYISLHATVPRQADHDEILRDIKDKLREEVGIRHSTVQLETADVIPLRRSVKACVDQAELAE
ncbi:cation diffusion facilitator family transporter [Parvularcula maris]|uniref:Cation diffusion facilitator family transporter n=1 Tax=Parvularcula maris TaxID=2965077 RepID=A0A9X2L8S3_9PROT|nr:cation diffusion facilitator family transporter [Parvularcula maris]MCQ8185066.1 cation diffusion facilitator family transporter [Parvularcula maris]